MNEKILLNNRSSTTIAGTERRAVVAIGMLVMLFCAKFSFLAVVIKRSVNARDCSKRNDVNGQYVTKKPHPLSLQRQI